MTIQDIQEAIERAVKGHRGKIEVREMEANKAEYARMMYNDVTSGKYADKLKYRSLTKTNSNGKVRHIDSPDLYTRVLQHLFILLIEYQYGQRDNMNALNCKDGCGITASVKQKSVIHRLKHIVYDRRDLNYVVVIDQRKCYEHVKVKAFRKALKLLTRDKWLIDFGVDVSFVRGRLPIGTPTSPPVHHILMLAFDFYSKQIAPFSLRYADDCIFATYTKESAQTIKWRVKNYWWYVLGMRSKRSVKILPLTCPIEFCGFIFHRNVDKGICEHNKGYVVVRDNIVDRARQCTNNHSWASYFGIMRNADCYSLMVNIERKMKLRELTRSVKIDRSMDAPNIALKDLVGQEFTIYDYETRKDVHGTPNWIKCLIGIEECDEDGELTGRSKAYEFHGGYVFLIEFLMECERQFGKKKMLPLEEMEIEQSCGYIFKGSTNQMKYINEY